MAFKLSGTMPAQTVDIKLPNHQKPTHPDKPSGRHGTYAGGQAHVKEYADGGKDVYINWD